MLNIMNSCLVTLGPTQDCCWHHPPFEIPKTTASCREYLCSWYTTVAGSVSFFDPLTLLLGNWFWYTTAVRPIIHRGNTPLCRPNLELLARQHCSSYIQIHLRAEGPIRRDAAGLHSLLKSPPLEHQQLH